MRSLSEYDDSCNRRQRKSGNLPLRKIRSLSFGEAERVYIATMFPFDEESKKRVQRHRNMRSGKGFETIECYTDLAQVRVSKGSTVLLECMSNLVANEMFQENGAHERTVQEILKGVKSLLAQAGNLVMSRMRSFRRRLPMRERRKLTRNIWERSTRSLHILRMRSWK